MQGREEAQKIVSEALEESIRSKTRLLENSNVIVQIGERFVQTLQRGGTIFLFGNGGSAADAQHVAAELIGRFERERQSLPAIALTVNTSNLTALANDYGYEQVFSRQLEALLKKEDLVVGISTSGNSPNVLEGVRVAKQKGSFSIGFTGEQGGQLKDLVDLCFSAPSSKTARIQEMHILVGHIVCQIVEEAFSGQQSALSKK